MPCWPGRAQPKQAHLYQVVAKYMMLWKGRLGNLLRTMLSSSGLFCCLATNVTEMLPVCAHHSRAAGLQLAPGVRAAWHKAWRLYQIASPRHCLGLLASSP